MAEVQNSSGLEVFQSSQIPDVNLQGFQNHPDFDISQYEKVPQMGMTPIIQNIEAEESAASVTSNNPILRLRGFYTPDTDVGNIPTETKPDISLYCNSCSKHITLKLLQEHRTYHRALETMLYHGKNRPTSISTLMQRRAALIKKLRSKGAVDNTINTTRLNHINTAFEFLRADLEETFDEYRRIVEDTNTTVQSLALNCSPHCAPVVAMCAHSNERWKSAMEDTRVFQDHFGNDPNKCYFALFDGHNGRFAAEVCANELHHFLLLEMEKFDPRTKCTCTFNMVENYDLSEYKMMKEIHSRPQSKNSERRLLHEESTNVIQQIIRTCNKRLTSMDTQSRKDSISEDQLATKKDIVVNNTNEKKKDKVKNPFAESMGFAFKKAHECTDVVLSYGKDEHSRVRWSGTSTIACVIQNTNCTDNKRDENPPLLEHSDTILTSTPSHLLVKRNMSPHSEKTTNSVSSPINSAKRTVEPPEELGIIHIANAGNAHAVLVRGNRAYRLTRDHTPANRKEQERVVKSGGSINEGEKILRVNGVLATTRGLGNHGDPALKRCVITEPYTTSVQIDQYAQFLILATNGVWEVFSEHEAAALLIEMLPSNQIPPPSQLVSSFNFIYGVTESPTNSEIRSEYSVLSSAIPTDRPKTTDAKLSESYKQVFGNLKSKSNVRISEELEHEKMSSKFKSKPESISEKQESIAEDMQTEVGSRAGDFENEVDSEIDDDVSNPRSRLSVILESSENRYQTFAKAMSERLVQAALLAGSKDNISVMVVLLPAFTL